jgi:hypothetical protein
MPELPALASAPVAFSSGGKYYQVPLAHIYFDRNGMLKADRWPTFSEHSGLLEPLLAQLRGSGVLTSGPAAPSQPAFTATAKTAGASGVAITITVTNVTANAATPAASTADVTVTETDTYTGLRPATLVETIGGAPDDGRRPGLVFVSSAAAPSLPGAGTYPMTAAAAGDPAQAEIPRDGDTTAAFTLRTRAGGSDAPLVTIEIDDVDSAAGTFTLVATWTKTQAGVAISGLDAAFDYIIDVTAPPDGFLAPAPGVTTLAGGVDALAVSAVPVSATVRTR